MLLARELDDADGRSKDAEQLLHVIASFTRCLPSGANETGQKLQKWLRELAGRELTGKNTLADRKLTGKNTLAGRELTG